MAFTFPDPSVSTTATNPETGITYQYADGMWTPVSLMLIKTTRYLTKDKMLRLLTCKKEKLLTEAAISKPC